MRLLPSGDRAILVELPDASARRRLDEILSRTAIPGIVEHVPAARTVLVTVTGPAALVEVSRALRCLDLSAEALWMLTVSLFIGTPALSGIGAIGAALTLGVRGGGVLLSLLVLPLYIPVLIFGAGAVDAVVAGLGAQAHLSLLGALTLGGVFFAPWPTAAALRIALE